MCVEPIRSAEHPKLTHPVNQSSTRQDTVKVTLRKEYTYSGTELPEHLLNPSRRPQAQTVVPSRLVKLQSRCCCEGFLDVTDTEISRP